MVYRNVAPESAMKHAFEGYERPTMVARGAQGDAQPVVTAV